ncbi:hypothetical protein EZ428_13000 [Pedobacter frigiditerrae]|uniref:Uncharacterized protein n=1 Tax=Pedobacter frigiditerrae TaxID=2530452 RepID=A0A4R0MT39_9SPHI|nr:hypothetical protein [Pedobacter frigiditerrae]TCC90195.1 hypothetical protein EZ428_13000 [Pedobacter frigiditerrae]
MEKFPHLKNEQVALLRADINTGIVLDKDYIYATTEVQEVYTVFDNIDSAIKFAKSIISERNDIECGIYGNDPVAFLTLTRDNIDSY